MIAIPEPDVTDVRRECLNHCLRLLPAENRELIVEYYRKEGRQKIDHRVVMAERLGIPPSALRSRAKRIRDKLERCIKRRLKDHRLLPTWKRTPPE
jgi:DNA-directed RNA polymerase specialized sigma24 family protein